MDPKTKSSVRQCFEIVTFVGPVSKSIYSKVSTFYAMPPVPLETTVANCALKVPLELTAEGQEKFVIETNPAIFTNAGKTIGLLSGCLDHFTAIYRTFSGHNDSDLISALKDENLSLLPSEIVSFIYKPSQNGWVAVRTERKSAGDYETSLFLSANINVYAREDQVKAAPDPLDDVPIDINQNAQELLHLMDYVSQLNSLVNENSFFYETSSNSGQPVKTDEGHKAFKQHLDCIISEIDEFSGHVSGMQKLELNRERLRELLSIVPLRCPSSRYGSFWLGTTTRENLN